MKWIPPSILHEAAAFIKKNYPYQDERFGSDPHSIKNGTRPIEIRIDDTKLGYLYYAKDFPEKEFAEWTMKRVTSAISKAILRILRVEDYRKYSDYAMDETVRLWKIIDMLTEANERLVLLQDELNADLDVKIAALEEERAEMIRLDEVRKEELVAALRRSEIAESEKKKKEEELQVINARLVESKEKEKQAKLDADTDPMTRLWNRRYGDRKVDEMIETSLRLWKPISVIYIDLDMFKSVNDTYGHDVWDLVLITVAEILKKAMVMEGGIAVRLWGEELGMILYNCDKERAMEIAETVRQTIENAKIPVFHDGQQDEITVGASLGVYTAIGEKRGVMLKRADQAMYAAKHGWIDQDGDHPGRNQSVYWKKEFDLLKKEDPKKNSV